MTEQRQHILIIEDLFLAIARLNTRLNPDARSDTDDITECLVRAMNRLDDLRDENGDL